MWIIQEPGKVALWSKRHFEENTRRLCRMFKIFSTVIKHCDTPKVIQVCSDFRLLTCIYMYTLRHAHKHTQTQKHSQSVGLLWTSDQLDSETFTLQHTTFTRDRRPCCWCDSNPRSQQASGHMYIHNYTNSRCTYKYSRMIIPVSE
jgi:hypothetical protein